MALNPAALLLLLPVTALFLQVTPSEYQPLTTIGAAGAMFTIYRIDRKSSEERYAADRKASEERLAAALEASEKRYSALALDFRGIVENTTKVITQLLEQDHQRKG